MSHLHGYSAYTRGCRCQVCRDAKATYMRTRRAAARMEAQQPRGVEYVVQGITHGRYGYEERGCRCTVCVRTRSTHRVETARRAAS